MSCSSDVLLEFRALSIAMGASARLVVDKVGFKIHQGQCVGLVGESGSGKTLTALTAVQLLPPAARVSQLSEVNFYGENILNYSERQMRGIRGKKIAMIFQDALAAFNPVLTIYQQIHEILTAHQHLRGQQIYRRAIALLEEVGIIDASHCLRCYPYELSGGMRQRAMIAMALAGDPELLIADEPTTALDVVLQTQVLAVLRQLSVQRNVSVLFISHDLANVAKLADDIVVLQKGRQVEMGSTAEFFHHATQPYSQKLLNAVLPLTARKNSSDDKKALLTVRDLQVFFPIRQGIFRRIAAYVKAVDDVSFTIAPGETLALVGESGCGKTTTAKAIIRLLLPTAGKIYLNDTDLTTLSGKTLRHQREFMQLIFQDPYSALDPRMRIADSLAEGLRIKESEIDKLLKLVELPLSVKSRYPHEFSGGERQRLCLVRALAPQPRLLILDEPTSALDVSIQKQILGLLDKLQEELGVAYLLITHDLGVVAYLAHRIAVMRRGRIVESGLTTAVLSMPQDSYTQQLISNYHG